MREANYKCGCGGRMTAYEDFNGNTLGPYSCEYGPNCPVEMSRTPEGRNVLTLKRIEDKLDRLLAAIEG